MLHRSISELLDAWRRKAERKPLVIRGARQVGKTTAILAFGRTFRQCVSLDLEKRSDREVFDQDLPVGRSLESIFFLKNADPREPSTLLFIDEIQNSPRAVQFLRYLGEERPDLAVIAAGSLLEVHLEKHALSFPVGRVEFMYVYPLTFGEYVDGTADDATRQALAEIPCPEHAVARLAATFREYTMVGGMPEIVASYAEHRDLARLTALYEALMVSYADDAAKYARNSTLYQYIRHAMETAPFEAGARVRFQGFGQSTYRSREMGEALRTLERAMILYLLYPTTGTELPLMPDFKRSPRLLYLDTGLVNYRVGLQGQYLRTEDIASVYRGRIAEHIVGQELLAADASSHPKPLFWVREKADAMAEVDYVHVHEGSIVPVEVKAGSTGTLRSLHQMIERTGQDLAVRLYAGKVGIHDTATPGGKSFRLLSLPYFLAHRLDAYIGWAKGMPPARP